MVMKRLSDRFSKPPVLENARNVDADVAAPVSGAPLVVKDGIWQPETEITTAYFTRKADVAIAAGQPVTVTATGVIPAVNGSVHGIAVAAVAAGSTCLILRQGKLTLPTALTPNTLLYIDGDTGALTDTPGAKAYYIGYTSETGDTGYVFFGGSGGGSGGGGGGTADGVTIVDNDGTLSVVSTSSPKPNTVIRTQDNGKISPDLLDSTNLFSGMQVRYLVPTGGSWDRELDKCVETPELPKVPALNTTYTLPSPFGNKPGHCVVWYKDSNAWSVHSPTVGSASNHLGTLAACSGDGKITVTVGSHSRTPISRGLCAPTAASNVPLDVCIAVYCQTTEVVATKVIHEKKKYLVSAASSWDKGDPEDYIILPDMPTKVAGGATQFLKMVSPFGDKLVQTEVWIKFAGVWRRGNDSMYHNGMQFVGQRSACPGDGYLYVNVPYYPLHLDTIEGVINIPTGSTGTLAHTYSDFELCVVASVPEELNLPTISAKELAESSKYGTPIDLTVTVPDTDTNTTWIAPANGMVTLLTNSGKAGCGSVRIVQSDGTHKVILFLNPPTNDIYQCVSVDVKRGQRYVLKRKSHTGNGPEMYFIPYLYDETKYALYSQTGGGQVNPEDAIRIGEIRNYSRYDSEIAENPAFLAIPVATEIDTASYPDFAALVGYTGRYPIPAADYCGAQSIPYIYLGKYTGDTLPELLPSDISVGSGYADARITFVVDDDGLEISVPLVTVGAADTPLGGPALLFDVEGAAEPMEMRLRASDQLSTTPDPMEILVKYAPRDK